MIASYADTVTYNLAHGIRVPSFISFERVALRKIRQLQISATLEDLRVPPGNRLEALKGDREGQYSIRINDQFRLCFEWHDGVADNVQVVDYLR